MPLVNDIHPHQQQYHNNHNNAHPRPLLSLTTAVAAVLYVLSGVTQPLLMTVCKDAGLSDSTAQLYMFFYYLGPASVGLTLLGNRDGLAWPSYGMFVRAAAITLFDIVAQAMNYTGAALAGPTIFAIVYSSVTVWTAVFSRIVLKRTLLAGQWIAVVTVFGGLAITAADKSVQVGSDVARGLVLVMFGSAMHAMTYVMGEVVMVLHGEASDNLSSSSWWRWIIGDKDEPRLSVRQNCAVQGCLAMSSFFLWQMVYTRPRFEELIGDPMDKAGTTWRHGMAILMSFAAANFVHAFSYFFTLKHFPGGATSAGVMKGLQAVLVFLVTDWLFCGKTGGKEMCFTVAKFISLVTVVGGVALFGIYTEKQHRIRDGVSKDGYSHVGDVAHKVESGTA